MRESAAFQSLELLQAIIDSLPMRVFWKDRELRFVGGNSLFARDAGLEAPAQLIGKTDFDMAWSEQAEAYRADDQRVMASGVARLGYEEPQTTPAGETIWLRTSKVPLRDAGGNITGILGIYEEITELKRAQQAEQRSKRALRLLSACNSVLVRTADEQSLLTETCRLAVETGGYRMAWAGFAEHDADKTVRPVAQSGFERGYLESANITWADSERGQGPTGTAIRTGQTQVNQNFLTNPRTAPWREQALKRGFRSSISLPLKQEAGVFGSLTIYAEEPDAFAVDEVRLLEELASDLAYGITTLRTRADLSISQQRLAESLEGSVMAIASVVESRDPYTAGHQRRVSALCEAIAHHMGLSEERLQGLHLAAMIHDLGKIHVPAEILTKPGRLSDIEFELVKSHAQVGYDILKDIVFPWPIADIVLQHHERIDGSGYPNGLKGKDILVEARILAVADVVESMASYRPYRPALGIDAALAEIREQRGRKYDAAVVDACMAILAGKSDLSDIVPESRGGRTGSAGS